MWYERLEELRVYRGVTKRRLAALLGLTEQHVGSLLNRGHDPGFSVVSGYARRLLLSLDWLDDRDVPMWSASCTSPIAKEVLLRMGEHRNYGERTRAIIRVLHGIDPAQFDSNFIALLLRSEVSYVESILGGHEEKVPLDAAGELINVFGISHEWLHTGVGEPLR